MIFRFFILFICLSLSGLADAQLSEKDVIHIKEEADKLLPESIWDNGYFRREVISSLPSDYILNLSDYLAAYRELRLKGSPHGASERKALDMLAFKLEQHRAEVIPKDQSAEHSYEKGIKALTRSLDELLGPEGYFNSRELASLRDERVQKILRAALKRNNDKGKREAPRVEARERVWIRLQEANGGEDPHELPPDFNEQVDAELAKMVASGEVKRHQPPAPEIPAPPRPGSLSTPRDLNAAPTARQAVKVITSFQNWSEWQLTALAALLGTAGWALWRRLRNKLA
jgi:hypothetical protein